MKTHLLHEGKKPQFIVLEAGDITLTGKDIAGLSRVLGKISPFAGDEWDDGGLARWHDILWRLAGFGDIKEDHFGFEIEKSLAINRTSPPALLEILFSREKPAINWNLARNPATPNHILWHFIGYEILLEGVASNPGASAGMLTRVLELVKDWDQQTITTHQNLVASNPSCPSETLTELLEQRDDKELKVKIAENPGAPLPLLERLYLELKDARTMVDEDAHPIFNAICANPSIPESFMREIRKDDPLLDLDELVSGVEAALSRNPNIPTEMLMEFATIDERTIFYSPSAPPSFLAQKAIEYTNAKGRGHDLIYIAKNRSTPPETLELLSKLDHEPLRAVILRAVAMNPSTPAGILHELFSRPHARNEIWNCIAANPRAPLDILAQFVELKDHLTRTLASNEWGIVKRKFNWEDADPRGLDALFG